MALEDLFIQAAGWLLLALTYAIVDVFWEGGCCFIGYWTLKLASFGRCEPDEVGWAARVTGLGVMLAVIWVVVIRLR
jgi:hypothetical protein